MSKTTTLTTALALVAAMTLAAPAAFAQTSGLTNGPNGNRPNSLSSNNVSRGINAAQPSRAVMSRHQHSGASLLHSRRRHRMR